MGKRKATETRVIILEMLMELFPGRESVFVPKENLLIRDVLNKYDYMDARDKAFMKRLTEGCVEQKIKLDYVIRQYSKTRIDKLKPLILNILRMGVYQILFMDTVPDAAACNEAVKLAVDKGFRGLSGYVNGILRTISREKENIPWPEQKNCEEYFSVMYSMPVWLVHMWLERYDSMVLGKMLAAFQEPSGLTIRLRETISEEQCRQWEKEVLLQGCELKKHPLLPYAYNIRKTENIMRLFGYAEGMFAVQDISSMLAVELAGIKKGDHVIDVCAAPGGKTMHAAEKAGCGGIVEAGDISGEKLELIRENAERLQPSMLRDGRIILHLWDARKADEKLISKADVVLADLPCSGLGVIGHKGDIRYRVTKQQVYELAQLQREILETVCRYLKPGGILLYSTCTISEEENEKNRRWILDHLPLEAVPLEISEACLQHSDKEGMFLGQADVMACKEGFLQLLPGIHHCDGFFIAKFKRKME